MVAIVHEAHHGVDVVEQAQAEGLDVQGDVDALAVRVIPKAPVDVHAPLPLVDGPDHFALPDVFTQDQEDVFRVPSLGQVDKALAPFQVELAHRRVEIDQAYRHDGQGND